MFWKAVDLWTDQVVLYDGGEEGATAMNAHTFWEETTVAIN